MAASIVTKNTRLCACGCGSTPTRREYKFIRGHAPRPVEKRFWKKVDKSPSHNGCWIWTASTDNGGYGHIGVEEKTVKAHRVSYEISVGPIPRGLCVCHSCDVRNCVNPKHLWLGTYAQNNADRKAKGRGATGERSGARTHPEKLPVGERGGRAKLKESEVVEIRAICLSGVMTQKEVARIYKVGKSAIGSIATRKTWKHVP